MLLQRHHSRGCRKIHSQAQRVFKTVPLYTVTNPEPTVASGPMPVAAIYGTKHYAVQSDHLNTPRRLVQSDGQVAWQWAYSAFGDEQPTIANNRFANTALNQSFGTTSVSAVTFNLRYPGQYFDQESNLHYNYHRSYSATVGRYTQSDPIGLDGGWNRFGYVGQNPLSFTDPLGLQASGGGLPNFNPTTPDQCEVASIWDLITKKRKKTDCSATMPTHTTCRACCTAKAMNGNYYELGTVCEAQCDDTKYPDNPIKPGPNPAS